MRENVIARGQRLQNRHGGGGAGGEGRGRFAAFEDCHTALQRLPIRIVVARVHEPARVRALDVAFERGGKINGGGDCPGCRIYRVPRVNGYGFDFHLCCIEPRIDTNGHKFTRQTTLYLVKASTSYWSCELMFE